MAQDVDTLHVFNDGDTVHGTDMNNIQDQSLLQPNAISGKTPGTPLNTDYILYLSAGTTLKKGLISAIPGVASVAATDTVAGEAIAVTGGTGPAVSIAITPVQQTGNVFLCSPPGGALGNPLYRKIVPKDLAIPYVPIAATLIDWSLGNFFYKQITVNPTTFTFSGGVDGQTIVVQLSQGGASNTVVWPAARWENGTIPVLSPGAGRVDFFQFWYLGTIAYGKRILTNAF